MSKKKGTTKKNKIETHGLKDKGFGLRIIFYWISVLSIWGVIGLILFGVYLAQDLPKLEKLPPPGQNNQVEVRGINGEVLATYGAVYGDMLAFEEIPKHMIEAIIAIEDRRFFDHGALDFRGIARAIYTNLTKGTLSQGASTLTQQLAKNIYLSFDRTLERKARELLLALWLEQRFTKKEIITLYLNRVYFGSGTYGIDSASQKYFGHTARVLTVQEAAMLAGLVKAP
jgi:penicillin-binding protein 1A